jgi:uncharacterized protein YndB with AHSA1/START domain
MHAIKHRLAIRSTPTEIFTAISRPEGLNAWWTKYCEGQPVVGSTFVFGFAGGFEWTADVTAVDPQRMIEWRFTDAEPDWTGTRLRMELTTEGQDTWVSFLHDGWAADNAHFCHSSFCWAQYLRLLRRWVEDGTTLPYEERSRA